LFVPGFSIRRFAIPVHFVQPVPMDPGPNRSSSDCHGRIFASAKEAQGVISAALDRLDHPRVFSTLPGIAALLKKG
jgi:hypothetical protein